MHGSKRAGLLASKTSALAGMWLLTMGLGACGDSDKPNAGDLDGGMQVKDGSTGPVVKDGGNDTLTDGGGDGGGPRYEDAAPGSDTVFVDERCRLGNAQNQATIGTLDVFGHITYFADGAELPAGTYRVVYEDGCMKFGNIDQGWTVHANQPGSSMYRWFMGAEEGDEGLRVPGTSGYRLGEGAFADFDECVAANLQLKPIAFKHRGGKLGVWLADSAYGDNVVGVDNRNPRWRLEHVNCDVDAGAPVP